MTTMNADPRTLGADGCVVGYDHLPRFARPSVGGLSSTVQRGDEVGVVVGLDTVPGSRRDLLLWVVWGIRPARSGRAPGQTIRATMMRRYQLGQAEVDKVPAVGLIALDAHLPDHN
jgi:hypothetical protein